MEVLTLEPVCKKARHAAPEQSEDTDLNTSTGGGGDSADLQDEKTDELKRSSRRAQFHWNLNCFICGKACHMKKRNTWSLVTDPSEASIYKSVLEAAEKRNDEEIRTRLLGIANGDLVAVEARYHRNAKNCLASYLNPRNIEANRQVQKENFKEQALKQVIADFRKAIVEENKVFPLSVLKKRYQEILRKGGRDGLEGHRNFKQLLLQTWNEVSAFPQPGTSDLICSSAIGVGDLLKTAVKLKCVERDADDNQADCCLPNLEADVSEEQITHRVVEIIRNRIKARQVHNDKYYHTPEQVTPKGQREFIDPLLYKMVQWLTNDKAFEEASETDSYDKRVLAICSDITTVATSKYSPKHLGLAISIHHKFASRTLIDDLHAIGHCMSYTELRHFITSAAVDVSSAQNITASGAVIPSEILSKKDGGHQPIYVHDNWDHNEQTIDGKMTTHALTSIIVAPANNVPSQPLRRLPERVLKDVNIPGGSLSSVQSYKKPNQRPEPVLSLPVRAEEILPSDKDLKEQVLEELLYTLLRVSCGTSSTPIWSSYHQSQDRGNMKVSHVADNPIIMNNPTSVDTLYTSLLRMTEVSRTLGFRYTPFFMDMGLLTKTMEIVWSSPELANVIPCEGGMHFVMAIFRGIGHLYGDAGLRNLLSESEVYAAGTVKQMLLGRDFNRMLRAIGLLNEVFTTLLLRSFKKWCLSSGRVLSIEMQNSLSSLEKAFREEDEVTIRLAVESTAELLQESLLPHLDEFRELGRQMSSSFKFWDDFIFRVSIPLQIFLSSTREGDWNAYQSAKATLLPLLFATGCTTYARYMPVMLLQMRRLPETVLQSFKDGLFVAKLKKGSFNGVWADYALETTQNKSLKGSGGIIGLTLKGTALARYFMAKPVVSRYASSFHQGIQEQEDVSRTNVSLSTTTRWNTDVSRLLSMFEATYADPFNVENPPQFLINFATGAVASAEVEVSMLNALDRGQQLAVKFVEERLVKEDGITTAKSFYDPLPKHKLKTMVDLKKSVKVNNREIKMDNECMFLRLTAINSRKKLSLERLMAFENASVPPSMFKEDGTLILPKNKSDFMHKLEENVNSNLPSVRGADCVIFDGHAVVHKLPFLQQPATFSDMAQEFKKYVLSLTERVSNRTNVQVHVVFDRYFQVSIKNQARSDRNGDTSTTGTFHIRLENQVRCNKEVFLQKTENKKQLASLYTSYIKQSHAELPQHVKIYTSGGEESKVQEISHENITEVTELKADKEEADTRIILHCHYAAEQGAQKIVVQSIDTDVLCLLVHHRQAIEAEEIFFLTGRETKHTDARRFVPVHEIYNALTPFQLNILLPVYCLSGCDTTSMFFGHGKRTAYKIFKTKADSLQGLKDLGSSSPTEEQKQACTVFVRMLYNQTKNVSLNKLRCEMATKGIPTRKMPPTDNSLEQHILRCAYQLMIWKGATSAIMTLPSPTQYGWTLSSENQNLEPVMTTQPFAAPELMNHLVCDCSPHCTETCTCLVNQQGCTAECACCAHLPGFNSLEETDCEKCTNPLTCLD